MIEEYWCSPDSPLRNLTESVRNEERVIYDGLRYSFQMAVLSYRRLQEGLIEVPNGMSRGGDSSELFTRLFSDAWVIVDSMHRFRGFAKRVDLEGAGQAMKPVVAATNRVKLLRNKIQHTSGTVEQVAKRGDSAWGSIKWLTVSSIKPFRAQNHIVTAGSTKSYRQAFINHAGEKIVPEHDVHLITLDAYGIELRIRDLILAALDFVAWIEEALYKQDSGPSAHGHDFYSRGDIGPGPE